MHDHKEESATSFFAREIDSVNLPQPANVRILIGMKIARYWTRAAGEANLDGRQIRVTARGWSDEGIDAARACARQIAQRVAERIASQPGRAPRYPYGDRPLPEPVLSEMRDEAGLSAVITRNAYGALVMNTAQMMFVDIDQTAPAPASSIKNLFGSLFGKPAPKEADPVIQKISQVIARRDLAARVYRTAAGYRVLITTRRFPVQGAESEALLNEFGSDPLYVRLCRMQESFRARLTPKPWRVSLRNPPVEFPFETAAAQAQFEAWDREYQSRTAGHATCAFQTDIGRGHALAEFEPLIRLHDERTRATSGLPLA